MDPTPGKVVIAPEVLTTIVRMTTLATPGVSRLSTTIPGRVSRVLRGARSTEGIDVEIQDGAVAVEVYIVASREAQLREVGERLQREIRRAISEIVGLPVRAVTVHVDDVADPFTESSPQA